MDGKGIFKICDGPCHEQDPSAIATKIVDGAHTWNSLWNQPEAAGLNAVAEGFRHLGFQDDHKLNAAERIVYEAL